MTGPRIIDGVLYGADEMVGNWVQAKLGGDPLEVPFTALGVLGADGDLVFGALWFNRRDDDIEVAMYAEDIRPSMPALFRRILAWPFDVLGAKRVTAEIEADNHRVIRFATGIGMQPEGVKRQAVQGRDKLIFGLLRHECPFLRGTHGQSTVTASPH